MEENKLDNISKKIFENFELEKPPKDFTEKLMLKIEQLKVAEALKQKPGKSKFMLIFTLTFALITLISYYSADKGETTRFDEIVEQIELPAFDLSILGKYFDFSIEIGLIAKLIIASVILLILVDIASGSVIDRIIDSRTKEEKRI
jgi:hypothetical protein